MFKNLEVKLILDELNAKDKIFQATIDLINDGEDTEHITVRQIAKKAGVNSALVNYYFQTKENLFAQVVGTLMGGIIEKVLQKDSMNLGASSRLLNILNTTADIAFKHNNICKTAISIELKQWCRNSCKMILPLLKEISTERSESDLYIIALQLMLPFHHIVIEPELYGAYLKTDFFDEKQRRLKIKEMFECVLSGL